MADNVRRFPNKQSKIRVVLNPADPDEFIDELEKSLDPERIAAIETAYKAFCDWCDPEWVSGEPDDETDPLTFTHDDACIRDVICDACKPRLLEVWGTYPSGQRDYDGA